MEFNEQDIKDILAALAEIKERLARIETVQSRPSENCSVHSAQIIDLRRDMDSIKTQMGKHNLIAATLGAIGAAIVLTIKYVAGK
jgi:formate dehydrogenase assembly factor FdhD